VVFLEKIRRQRVRIIAGIGILLFFLVFHPNDYRLGMVNLSYLGAFIQRIDNFLYDSRLILTMPDTQDERIVILDIDDRSLSAEGHWPWHRDKLAALLDTLFDHYRAGIVGFDIVFPEPEDSAGLEVLEELARTDFKDLPRFRQRLEQLRPELDHDALFGRSMAGRKVVLGYYFSHDSALELGKLPSPVLPPGQFLGRNIDFFEGQGYGANLPVLQDNALSAGHFNPDIDADGVVRRVPMLYKYQGAYYESLSLAVARAWTGMPPLLPGYAESSPAGSRYPGIEWLQMGNLAIPVDKRVRTLVPYRGAKGSFSYRSITDVMHQKVPREALEGRIILIGTTAPGLQDLRSAPVQRVFPGVEIHANLISGILDNTLKKNPAYTLGVEFLLMALTGLVMALFFPLLSPLGSSIATAILLSLLVALNLGFWTYGNLALPLAGLLILVFLMFLFHMSYGFFVETRSKRRLAHLFGQYVPPELVEEMSTDPDAFSMEGESREMTVLFSDVRGFTSISEGLDPEDLARLMNAFLTPMTAIIHRHRGTIDKYMGDAIMAFWGAPLPDREHARRALQAGMAMIKRLNELRPEFIKKGWPALKIGVGINTGTMKVGNMGSEFRMAYTVLGDAVNLGSRLEGLTKVYEVEIIVSESTKEAVPEFLYRDLDRVRVKGKDQPVYIYEPLGPAESVDAATWDELKLYHKALRFYRAKQWDMAEIQFLNLHRKAAECPLYKLYLERIALSRQQEKVVGEEWDGVFSHTTK
jgi:adenylate cyclase